MRPLRSSSLSRCEASPEVAATLVPPTFAEPWGAEELAAALDSAGTGIWALDPQGRCVYINRAACQILGYARGECLGHKLQCRIHRGCSEDRACSKEACRFQNALESDSAVQVDDDVIYRRDGTPIAARYSVQPLVVNGRERGAVISISEIAKQKLAEETARRSEQRLTATLSAAGIGLCYRDSGETTASGQQFRLYGLEPAETWLSRERWLQAIHPEDRERVEAEQRLAMEQARPYSIRFRVVWPDGSVHWLMCWGKVFDDDGDSAKGEITVDITDRVRSEEALNQFFSASPTPLAVWGFDGRVQQVNPAWEKLLGFTLAEVKGLPLFDRIHPEDRAAAAAEFEKALVSGEHTGFECRVRCKDGSHRWLRVSGSVAKDAQVIYVTADDITSRKAAEETLRDSEARLRSAFQTTLFGTAIVSLDGRFLEVNQSLCRMTGFTEQELLQTDFAAMTHPDDLRETLELKRALTGGAAPAGSLTKRYSRKDGGWVWTRVHVTAVCDAQGAPRYFVLLIEDLTDQKAAEDAACISEYWEKFAVDAAGIGLCRGESGETTASEQQFRLHGLEPAEEWISRERWLQTIHPEDRERVEAMQRLAAEQDKPYDLRYRVVWPDGSIHWLLCRGKVLDHDGGRRKAEITVDITESKRAEEALENLINMSRSPIAIIGFDGRIKRLNAALLRTTGCTAEELTSRPAIEFFHPDDRATIQTELRRLITQGGDGEFECRGLRKDGSFVWLVFSATAAPDDKSIFTVAHDVTERKRAEEALRASEEKFRELFDGAPVAYHELDTDGVVRRVNRAECALLGYEAGEILGRPVWEFVAGVDREAGRKAVLRKLSGEQPLEPVERRYVRRDGGELWIDVHDILVRNATGEVIGIRTALLDVTERKRAEAALAAEALRRRTVFEQSKDGILIYDRSGKVRESNQSFANMLGYSQEEMLGLHVWDWDGQLTREHVLEMIGDGKSPPSTFETRHKRKDGSLLDVGISSISVELDGDLFYYAVVRDISARKRMESDLRADAEKLARSNEELERFAYVASHDLQEPLRMVASFTQLLSKKYSGRLDETADRYINFAVDGAKRMQALIGDLLAYSRVSNKDLELRPTDCEAVAQRTLQNLRVAIDESGAVVEWEPLPVLDADTLQLGQLFQNLIGNAVKFRGQAPPRVHIAAADNGADWLFSVRDNGIGLDPGQADRIFQVFQRLHSKEQYPGTGIGLAVCKKVVERHGGRIWVESQPGAGSNFRFTLPKTHTDGGAHGSA